VTWEPYVYTYSDPVNGIDPNGLICITPDCAVRAAQSAAGVVRRVVGNGVSVVRGGATAAKNFARAHLIPDYVTVTIGYGLPIPGPVPVALNVGGQVSVTKDGHVYAGSRVRPGTLGPSFFPGAGYVNGGRTSACDRDNFVGARGATLHGQVPLVEGVGPGASFVYGTPGQYGPHATGKEYGVGVFPNFSVTGSYSFWRIR
jgi:hypothetical protein